MSPVLQLILVVAGSAVGYALLKDAKLAELARITFFCALLWLLYLLAGGRAHL